MAIYWETKVETNYCKVRIAKHKILLNNLINSTRNLCEYYRQPGFKTSKRCKRVYPKSTKYSSVDKSDIDNVKWPLPEDAAILPANLILSHDLMRRISLCP